jgi:hypothetical protein
MKDEEMKKLEMIQLLDFISINSVSALSSSVTEFEVFYCLPSNYSRFHLVNSKR